MFHACGHDALILSVPLPVSVYATAVAGGEKMSGALNTLPPVEEQAVLRAPSVELQLSDGTIQ